MKNRFNWTIVLECKDCGSQFHHESPRAVDPSVQVFTTKDGTRHRMAMVHMPNECPECHNIRLVPAEKPRQRPKLLATSKKPT